MTKKLLIGLMTAISAICCAFGLSACGEGVGGSGDNGGQGGNQTPPAHTVHTYDKKVTESKYLKSEASCTQKAVYYFSCDCGEKGEETFEYGDIAEHDFKAYVSDENATCIKNCTETAVCENCNETDTREIADSATGRHIFESYVSDENATCIKNCTETAKCENCNETDTREIADSKTEHNYTGKSCSVCGAYKPTEGLAFTLNDDNASYSCTGKGNTAETDIVIPAEYNGLPVTAVAELAFAGNKNITSAVISNGVTAIEGEAFYGCTNMTSVIVPDSVTSIGEKAFSGCGSLVSMTLPFVGGSIKTEKDTYQYPFGYIFGTDRYEGGVLIKQTFYGPDTVNTVSESYCIPSSLKNVTITGGNILRGAFLYCSYLSSVTLSEGITAIGREAFQGCGIISISLPEGLQFIGEYAFSNCNKLTNVTIPDSVTRIDRSAFKYCDKLKFNEYSNGCYLGNENNPYTFLVCAKDYSVTSCTINKKTKIIGSSAFEQYTALTEINIPDSVISIENMAFSRCTNLKSITLGKGIVYLGSSSFYNCYNAKVTYEGDVAGWCRIDGIDRSKMTLRNVYVGGQKWQDITSIIIPDGVTTVYSGTFENCSELKSIIIPDSVTDICDSAFIGCAVLTKINIPYSVKHIGSSVFNGCNNLTEITVDELNEYYSSQGGILYNKEKTEIISVPKAISGSVTVPDGVTKIFGFSGCNNLTEIIIPDSANSIEDSAFYGCYKLKKINIPDGVTFIGYSAFQNCNSLQSIIIPDGVTYIGDHAFYNCSNLPSIIIPGGVTYIGRNAFQFCNLLTIYCEADSKPSGWNNDWNISNVPVVWNYTN